MFLLYEAQASKSQFLEYNSYMYNPSYTRRPPSNARQLVFVRVLTTRCLYKVPLRLARPKVADFPFNRST